MGAKKRPPIPPTKELEWEIRVQVIKYVEANKAKRKFNWGDFFNEVDVARTLWSKMVYSGQHSITLDTAVRLLDGIGMKLQIVPKNEKRMQCIKELSKIATTQQ